MANRKEIDSYTEKIINSFRVELKKKRIEQALSIEQLAKKADIAPRTLFYAESGKWHTISLYTIISLSVALDFYDWEFIKLETGR